METGHNSPLSYDDVDDDDNDNNDGDATCDCDHYDDELRRLSTEHHVNVHVPLLTAEPRLQARRIKPRS